MKYIFSLPKTWRKQKPATVFHPRSCVPENERFLNYKQSAPGPGRYNVGLIACPCKKGSAYSAQKEIEQEKLSWQNPNRPHPSTPNKCVSPAMRDISGHGHTWVFRSGAIRLLTKPTRVGKGKATHHIRVEHDAKYIKMIANPVRNAISYPTIDFTTPKVLTIKFNCIERPMKRSKLRNNKKVAFMSGCPRFPINKLQQIIAMSKTKCFVRKVTPQAVVVAPKEPPRINSINLMEPIDRLLVLPRRYLLAKPIVDQSDKMRNTFEALPPARILIQDTKYVSRGSVDKIHGQFRVENYFKQEYRATG